MNILAIVAHPDDDAIFCGGTLAKHAARGDEVHVTYMTRGELGGSENRSKNELADTRTEEAREAADHLGVSTSFLDFEDGHVEYSLDNRHTLTDEIRQRQSDLLITHFREDPHPDHRATSKLVTDAYYASSLPLFETEHEPTDPDNVYYFGKPTTEFEPDLFVDVSEQQPAKEDAIREHKSQVEFLDEHGGIDTEFEDLIETVRAEGRVLGRRCGVQFAEGFTRLHEQAREYLGD